MTTMIRTCGAFLAALAVAILAPAAQAGTITYFHNDLAGSALAATNEQGQVIWRESYRPYGERLVNSPAASGNSVWFTSRRQDAESGLVYLGARHYDPVAGRFVSVDPAGFDEGNVHSFNRYAYANNNPYRYVDPDGRSAAAILPIAVGAIIIGGGFRSLPDDQRRAIASGLSALGNNSILGQIGSILGQMILSESDPPMAQGATTQSGGADGMGREKDPSTPTGRRGSPMDVASGTNEPTSIGGRDYSGHALDRMQGRGVPPSAVEEAIRNGQSTSGNRSGTKVHSGPDGVTVVTGERGQVVTVIPR